MKGSEDTLPVITDASKDARIQQLVIMTPEKQGSDKQAVDGWDESSTIRRTGAKVKEAKDEG